MAVLIVLVLGIYIGLVIADTWDDIEWNREHGCWFCAHQAKHSADEHQG